MGNPRPHATLLVLALLAIALGASAQEELERLSRRQAELREETLRLEARVGAFVASLGAERPAQARQLETTWGLLRELLLAKRMERVAALLERGESFEAEQQVAALVADLEHLLGFLAELERGVSNSVLDEAELHALARLVDDLLERQRSLRRQARSHGLGAALAGDQRALAEEVRSAGHDPRVQASLRALAEELRAAGRSMAEAAGACEIGEEGEALRLMGRAIERLAGLHESLRVQGRISRARVEATRLSELESSLETAAVTQRALAARATELLPWLGEDERRFVIGTRQLAAEQRELANALQAWQRRLEERGRLVFPWLLARLAERMAAQARCLQGALEQRCDARSREALEETARVLDNLAAAVGRERRRVLAWAPPRP